MIACSIEHLLIINNSPILFGPLQKKLRKQLPPSRKKVTFWTPHPPPLLLEFLLFALRWAGSDGYSCSRTTQYDLVRNLEFQPRLFINVGKRQGNQLRYSQVQLITTKEESRHNLRRILFLLEQHQSNASCVSYYD